MKLPQSIIVVVALFAACKDNNDIRPLEDAPPPPDMIIDTPTDVEVMVTTSGNGSGRITSSPAGIDCGSECAAMFPFDTMVTLTADPDTSSDFAEWGGACSGSEPTCEVTLSAVSTVTATFTLKKHTVMVSKLGAGTGTVAGGGIDCGGTCELVVDHGTTLSLAATPGALAVFVGWGGACSGAGACEVTVTADTTVSAAFALDDLTLFVTKNGTGTVTSNPAGINCGTTCDAVFTANQTVNLTAVAGANFQFTGWSGGGCTGTGACAVTMDQAKTVTATFTRLFTVTVARAGGGTGTVVSNPAGSINCPGDCTHTALSGATMNLVATPTVPGSMFTGWSGGGASCAGTGNCTVTFDASKTVTATFEKTRHAVTITGITGNGRIDSSPAGITDCRVVGSASCTAMFDYGTVVTLTPSNGGTSAANASVFTSWGGDCSGSGACAPTVTGATNVTASFRIAPNIMFTTSRVYSGGLPNIQAECDALATAGGLSGDGAGQNRTWVSMISYSASLPFSAVLAQVGNPTGWARPDGRAVFNTLADLAASRVYYPPRLDERGTDLGEAPRVWTGTNADGSFNSRCAGFGTTIIPWGGTEGSAYFGLASASSGMLATFRPGDTTRGVQTCDLPAHLYCMGVDRKATVSEPRSAGRIAFTTSGQWAMNSGLANADALCRSEATTASLSGTFKAFLPGIDPVLGARSAIGRFDTTRATWVRAGDNVPIVRSAADLASGTFTVLETAPNATANGTRIGGNVEHWSGSRQPVRAPAADDNCNSWSDASFLGKAGFVGDTSLSIWWDYDPFHQRCASGDTRKILCFQE